MEQFEPGMLSRKTILFGIITVIGLAMIGFSFYGSEPQPPAASAHWEEAAAPEMQEAAPAEAEETIVVHISGAVQAPDVYRLPANARLKELVMAAGGLTNEADADMINLAARLEDSQHIVVPHRSVAAEGHSEITPPESDTGLVNLNTASAAELEDLDGIGKTIAGRIIEYRNTNGPFKQIEDLQEVDGIGDAVYNKIASQVEVKP